MLSCWLPVASTPGSLRISPACLPRSDDGIERTSRTVSVFSRIKTAGLSAGFKRDPSTDFADEHRGS
jgi:hypothetical protein